ncbi:hypothetical protein M9Y10_045583 [Tritrichomonas musculus]|uniref:RRM domain-containing protein n=1 Tax=Tritrichomonas musculus TaxID=1915356 RepID=A0ABR2JVN0_9EUKA
MKNHRDAVNGLNGREIEGSIIRCGRFKTKEERKIESEKWRKASYEKYKGRVLYVKNFDETVTDEDLNRIFSQFGNVESAKVMRDNESNSTKFGFVCFETEQQAEKCYVTFAMSKDQKLKQNLAKSQQQRVRNNPQINNAPNQMQFPAYGGLSEMPKLQEQPPFPQQPQMSFAQPPTAPTMPSNNQSNVPLHPGTIPFPPEGQMPIGFAPGILQFDYPQQQLYHFVIFIFYKIK